MAFSRRRRGRAGRRSYSRGRVRKSRRGRSYNSKNRRTLRVRGGFRM